MRRDRSWLLVPFVACMGACADSVTGSLPRPPDVVTDSPAGDSPVGTDVAIDLMARDGQPDAPQPPDDSIIVDDNFLPGDNPPPDDTVIGPDAGDDLPDFPDVIVDDVTTIDVPIGPDAPPPIDTPIMPDSVVPPDMVIPPDVVVPACPNGISDLCPPGGVTRCADLNDGRPHTLVFTGFMSGLPASCEGMMSAGGADGVVPLTLTVASDVVITSMPTGGDLSVLSLYRPGGCGMAMQEAQCANPGGTGGMNTTLRATSLPAGTYWLQVAALRGAATIVQATITPARPRAPGDLCPGVAVTPDAGPTTLSTMGFAADGDYGTSCGGGNGGNTDSVLSFTIATARDVTIDMSATGGGAVSAELNTVCGSRASAVPTCANGNPARRTFRSLAAGTYFITVTSGMAGRTLVASVTTAAPTMTGPADRCPGVPLAAGTGASADVATLTPGITAMACVPNLSADAAFSIVAPAAGTDVLVHVLASMGDVGLQLQQPCGGMNVGFCAGPGPGRMGRSFWERYSGLTAGGTYAIVVGTNATAGTVTAGYLTIPAATTTTMVTANTACTRAQAIGATGGIFRGNTSMSGTRSDFMGLRPSCGVPGCLGGRTVFYRLDLTVRRHVIATMNGGFDTFLWVNTGATCPGTNVMNGCNDDAIGTNSQLDITLDAGTYWVMGSGCGLMAEGDYTLDVVVTAP